ncbi:MAG: hypothetical protein RSF40_01510 [Oscillospiraceae bacterium]
MNDKRWEFETDECDLIEKIIYNTGHNSYNISVSFVDYIKLSAFLSNIEKQKDKMLKNENLRDILQTAQADINARHIEANNYINDAKKQ